MIRLEACITCGKPGCRSCTIIAELPQDGFIYVVSASGASGKALVNVSVNGKEVFRDEAVCINTVWKCNIPIKKGSIITSMPNGKEVYVGIEFNGFS